MNSFESKRILVVDDSKFSSQVVSDILKKHGYTVKTVHSGKEAIEHVLSGRFLDLILMDIELGKGMDGIETAYTIQQHRDLPIVFLTAHADDKIMEKVRSVTGYGYVTKGSDEYALVSAVEMALRLFETHAKMKESEEKFRLLFETANDAIFLMDKNVFIDCNRKALEMFGCVKEQIIGKSPVALSPERQPDGELSKDKALQKIEAALNGKPQFFEWVHVKCDGTRFYTEVSLNAFHVKEKKLIQAIVRDVTERKRMQEELRLLSITDPLTGVYNRRYFIQKLKEEIDRAKRTNRSFSLIMLDIDYFKNINDRFGHSTGDFVLKTLTEMLKNSIRRIDIFARWGGEEFVILLPETPKRNAVHVAEKLRHLLSGTNIPGVGTITASFGISEYHSGDKIDSLIQRADDAMYRAKAAGRNRVEVYDQ